MNLVNFFLLLFLFFNIMFLKKVTVFGELFGGVGTWEFLAGRLRSVGQRG